jgi:hypothetical protein
MMGIKAHQDEKKSMIVFNLTVSGNKVAVICCERNATSNEPVLKIGNENRKTFGVILKLSANGTIL